jgi:LuxR family transcriptional regulator, maltose regulon positive regulatory protein
MSAPILVTKLYIPPARPEVVPRPRLIARLNDGLRRRLTLVAAPAGFGKTTLIGAWIAGCGRPAAWLSLDAGESDPARFLAYLVAALRTAVPTLGVGALRALQSTQPPPIEAVLTVLLNEIAALPNAIVLVLDDYHAIEAAPVDQAIAFLVEHLPPQLHLVIASREDPPLPLARLRAQGQLNELRAADLRFTAAEAAEFLNTVMGLDLAADDIAALETRTEGWVAGLQLAALSMQGRTDTAGFVRAFAGDDRYVVDYLVEEVLRRQPADVRSFLLQTAILARLSGPLCDAVTGQDGGSARLEALERGNFFLVPLDDKRHWYRYHHLFADVLQGHLLAEQPGRIPDLHRRASAWHEQHGEVSEAIRHALAAGDDTRAADLIERALPVLRRNRLGSTLLGWLRALPDEVVRRRPVLSAMYAWGLMSGGEFAGVEARLRDAERWLDAPTSEMIVADEEEFRQLPATIAIYRAAHAQARGDLPATVTHAWRVLDLVPEGDHLRRGAAAGLLGIAAWASGDLAAAHRTFAEAMASLQRAGMVADAINGADVLARIEMAQGRLRDAERTLEQAVQRATELGEPSLQGTADFSVGLSELSRERNDLDAATRHLLEAQELAAGAGGTLNRSRWCAAMARIKEAQGDLDGALVLFDEAERRSVGDFHPDVRPVAAQKARVWVAQGRLADAETWARERGLSAEDDLGYLREFEHITLARMLIARDTGDRTHRSTRAAMGLLERLLHAAEAGERTGSAIEILLLHALAHRSRGDLPAALAPLQRALTLAEPEGYVRRFVDEGEAMRDLLRHAAAGGVASAYARRLLSAFDAPPQPGPAPARVVTAELAEPLTAREVAILRLVAAGLRNQEIADQLYISLPTVKRHIANAYGKLGVAHRTEAVARATELGLL